MAAKLIRDSELRKMLGVSHTTLWRWRKDPSLNFPQPVRLGPNVIATDADELAAWLALRKDAAASA